MSELDQRRRNVRSAIIELEACAFSEGARDAIGWEVRAGSLATIGDELADFLERGPRHGLPSRTELLERWRKARSR